jgi:rRNA processing protein Gar1
MCLQRLGKVLHVTPSQNVVIEIEKTPKLGSRVVNDKLQTVGRIFDLIGPTSSPYAILRPIIEKPESLVKKQLYVPNSKEWRKMK